MVASAAMVLVTTGVCTTLPATSSACAPRRSPPVAIAYVTDYGSNAVSPIYTRTNTAGNPIKVGRDPLMIAITPDGKIAYVLNTYYNPSRPRRGTVTPIRTATNRAGKPIKVGFLPSAIAITPDGKTAYVVSFTLHSNVVTPIRTATNTVGKPIRLEPNDGGSAAIAITPNGKTAYVANSNSGTMTPIRTATNTAGKPIKVGRKPADIAITPHPASLRATFPV